MTIFLDTSIIVAFLNKRDSRNSKAQKVLDRIWENEFGRAMTTDYVIDEAYTWLASHTKMETDLQSLFHFIHGNNDRDLPRFIDVQFVTSELYFQTWKLHEKYIDRKLSFTDLTTLAICSKHGVGYIASFDTDFDGLLTRIT
jgi:predicted nucleic acid-binding protein